VPHWPIETAFCHLGVVPKARRTEPSEMQDVARWPVKTEVRVQLGVFPAPETRAPEMHEVPRGPTKTAARVQLRRDARVQLGRGARVQLGSGAHSTQGSRFKTQDTRDSITRASRPDTTCHYCRGRYDATRIQLNIQDLRLQTMHVLYRSTVDTLLRWTARRRRPLF